MTKKEFGEAIVSEIINSNALNPEQYNVWLAEVEKDNGTIRQAIRIKDKFQEGLELVPTLYIEDLFEMYEDFNLSIYEASNRIVKRYDSAQENPPQFDVNKVLSYESVKNDLHFKLADPDIDKSTYPYLIKDGFKVFPYVELSRDNESFASFRVDDAKLALWGVDIETVVEDALSNEKDVKYKLADMQDMLPELMGLPIDVEVPNLLETSMSLDGGMYVLSNEKKYAGANGILLSDIKEKISELSGGDFYILPSSKHEVIILPLNGVPEFHNPQSLADMVQEINGDQVDEEDRLSNKAFLYDSETKTIVDAVEFEKEKQEINNLATDIDNFMYDLDPYSYQDDIGSDVVARDKNKDNISKSLRTGDADHIVGFMRETIEDSDSFEIVEKAEKICERVEKITNGKELSHGKSR